MNHFIRDFIDLLYPIVGPGCSKVLATGENFLCTHCELDLPVFRNEFVIDHLLGGRVEIKASAIYLKFYSGGLTQQLLHEVKYKNNRKLGEYLGRRFMESDNFKQQFEDIDVVVPIPLHEEKLRQRGYNQSEVIARGITAVLKRPIDTDAVQRIYKSETQTRKSRQQRWQNVAGIFTSKKEALKDKDVLLVDDVITTGATMEACAQAVFSAGANSVSFAVLAVAM